MILARVIAALFGAAYLFAVLITGPIQTWAEGTVLAWAITSIFGALPHRRARPRAEALGAGQERQP